MMDYPTNVWGDPVAEALPNDPWTVSEDLRRDMDDPTREDANALDEGDDLDGWESGDPV